MRNLLDARRDARLGSDAEAGRHARLTSRRIHRQVLREKWRVWAKLVGAVALLTALAVALQPNPFARGLTLGVMIATTIALIAFGVVLLGGTAPLMMGEVAEQWTAQSLRRLLPHGWHLANHLLLNDADADHVLLGPGGVFVLETKWRREAWREGTDFDRNAAIAQARGAAAAVGLRLGGDVHVEPVVVLWTSAASTRLLPDTEQRYGDVVVLPGRALESWALRRGRAALDEQAVAQLWTRLRELKLRNVEYERVQRPIPTSFDRLLAAGFGMVLLAGLGFLASAELFAFTRSFAWWLAGVAVVALGYTGARRSARLRRPALAFAVGWAASVLLVAVVVIRALLF